MARTVYDSRTIRFVLPRTFAKVSGSLADIHWSFGEMIAYASRGTRVEPGDVIGSGTCGTGCLLELRLTGGEDAHPWLRAGDTVTLAVEHLGELTNTVVQ